MLYFLWNHHLYAAVINKYKILHFADISCTRKTNAYKLLRSRLLSFVNDNYNLLGTIIFSLNNSNDKNVPTVEVY